MGTRKLLATSLILLDLATCRSEPRLRLAFTAAALLADGSVLVTGGYDDRIRLTSRTWRYRPEGQPWGAES